MTFDFEVFMLILRVTLLLFLALFLYRVASISYRDLKAGAAVRGGEDGAGAHLVLTDPGQTGLLPGAIFPLQAISSVGRRMSNHVPLNDDFISSEHALICQRSGQWWVEDLGSTNGTFVNGHPISSPTAIAFGDAVEFGRVKAKLTR